MMSTFGWVVFIVGGAWGALNISLIVCQLYIRGGRESIPLSLFVSGSATVTWLCFSLWLSPFSISFN